MTMPQKNALEWTVFAASLALVLAFAGFLLYDALAGAPPGPPQLVVRPGEPRPEGDLLTVPVVVENTGEQAAEQVLVVIAVRQAGGIEETGELTFDLIPGQSSQEGQVTVPLGGAFEAIEGRVASFRLP
jgi:uncharacterized protein (TIGR02588 family)